MHRAAYSGHVEVVQALHAAGEGRDTVTLWCCFAAEIRNAVV